MKPIEKKIETLVKPTVEEMGYELADVEFIKEADGWVLTLYIVHENGIQMRDCENVSRAVDPIIEEADPIAEAYILSVSSLGIDRPFKKLRDYERAIGKEIEIHLYAPVDKKKRFEGVLTSADQDQVILATDGQEKIFERKTIAKACPVIRFE